MCDISIILLSSEFSYLNRISQIFLKIHDALFSKAIYPSLFSSLVAWVNTTWFPSNELLRATLVSYLEQGSWAQDLTLYGSSIKGGPEISRVENWFFYKNPKDLWHIWKKKYWKKTRNQQDEPQGHWRKKIKRRGRTKKMN